jgi:hypothetical protein
MQSIQSQQTNSRDPLTVFNHFKLVIRQERELQKSSVQ